jgi:dCTP deaminase
LLKSDTIADLLQAQDSRDPLVVVPRPDLGELRKSGAASIDLRLGTWFLALRPARLTALSIHNPGPEAQLTKSHYVPFGSAYVLHPRAFVLGATLEWLRLPTHLAGYVIGRSSWGRRGLIIATATGVHPGFKGCLTLELTNVGEVPIEIHPGTSVCQLCLHELQDKRTETVDSSPLAGMRRPTLGRIQPDKLAAHLAHLRQGSAR